MTPVFARGWHVQVAARRMVKNGVTRLSEEYTAKLLREAIDKGDLKGSKVRRPSGRSYWYVHYADAVAWWRAHYKKT